MQFYCSAVCNTVVGSGVEKEKNTEEASWTSATVAQEGYWRTQNVDHVAMLAVVNFEDANLVRIYSGKYVYKFRYCKSRAAYETGEA